MVNEPERPTRPQSPNQSVLVPLKLDAFVFNSSVCGGIRPESPTDLEDGDSNHRAIAAKIAPIEQPKRNSLGLDSTPIQPCIQNPVDLFNSWPSSNSSRYTSFGPEKAYSKRNGVYLHWTLPRLFRTALPPLVKTPERPKTPSSSEDDGKGGDKKLTLTPPKDDTSDVFPFVPNRWLVIRHIPDQNPDRKQGERTVVPKDTNPPEFAAWVIESDRLWDLKNLGPEVDLQTGVSPFIVTGGQDNNEDDKRDSDASKQADVFIGHKEPLENWTEKYNSSPGSPNPQPEPLEPSKIDESEAKFLPQFSLLTSSDPMFADYQPRNSNVFSMCDNFEYEEGKYLHRATAHYYVVGWYAEPENDPLSGPLLGKNADGTGKTRKQKLEALNLKIKLENPEGKQLKGEDVAKIFDSWLSNDSKTQMVCHGAMYGVKWDMNKKPDNVPADMLCTQLNSTVSLAVGTTPLDAVTTYARTRTRFEHPKDSDKAQEPKDPNKKSNVTVSQLEKWITELERHLLVKDDGVETQNQVSDILYNWNFARTDGGQSWNAEFMDQKSHSSDRPNGTPLDLVENLRKLNTQQTYLDAINRAMSRVRRDMSSVSRHCVTYSATDKKFAGEARELKEKFDALEKKQAQCVDAIKDLVDSKRMQQGARPAFYEPRDPTLLVAGVSSGWQYDYMDDLLIRLDEQKIVEPRHKEVTKAVTSPWDDFETSFGDKFPKTILPAVKGLVEEFRALGPESETAKVDPERKTSLPLFHDQYSLYNPSLYVASSSVEEPKLSWRDRWNNSQPWFPLFLDWEIEYHHIPFENWKLSSTTSRTSNIRQLRYGIRAEKDIREKEPERGEKSHPDEQPNKQQIQGRCLILPQPSFFLSAKIEQLFAETPQHILNAPNKENKYDYLSPDDRKSLQKELHKFAFLSAPLAHLTSMIQGHDIEPNTRNAMANDLESAKELIRPKSGLDEENLMSIKTDNTPLSTQMRPPVGSKNSLFKPVTHGQFRFTKLDIIDKFGQAIHAITPSPEILPEPIWPYISEWYAPQLIDGTKEPKVVAPRETKSSELQTEDETKCAKKPQDCEFVQVPPMINQYSRLNATFVVRVTEADRKRKNTTAMKPYCWRPADEWENPVWGWVLTNYTNQSIQLFTQDGTFYREVRLGGPKGTLSSPEWLPFRQPHVVDGPETAQLQLLVSRLGDVKFMHEFWEMIKNAADNMQPAPEAYAGFADTALVGRPLALAQAGWSLELAVDELSNQTDDKDRITRKLLGKSRDAHQIEDENSDKENDNPGQYTFNVHIGGQQAGFDGLVGLFRCDKYADDRTRKGLGLKLDTVYSNYHAKPKNPPKQDEETKAIAPMTPLVLRPFYPAPHAQSNATDFAEERNKHLSVRGVLLDPFSPIHAYSGILPVRELVLPPWTWQGALSKIKTFLHIGPLLLEKTDPDTSNANRKLIADDLDIAAPDVIPENGPAPLPDLGNGGWAWLQSYGLEDGTKR